MSGYERQVMAAAAKRKNYPFAAWFGPDGRTYIDFQATYDPTTADDDITLHFRDSDYTIHDYAAGMLKDKYNRLVRIGKVINREEAFDLQNLRQKAQEEGWSAMKLDAEVRRTQSYYQDMRRAYESSPYRVGAKNQAMFKICFTMRPEDVAAMSTNRNWTSCMQLGSGSNHESIWCEISHGGFVAYLIRATDTDIDKPLARIHVRRFDNKQRKSVAVPEDSIYGDDMPGFKEAVQRWLDEKQGVVRPGLYVRRGGFYSDTFGSDQGGTRKERIQKRIHSFLPSTNGGLFKIVEKMLGKQDKKPYHRSAMHQAMEKLLAKDRELSEAEKMRLIQLVRSNNVLQATYGDQILKKYPDLVNPESWAMVSNSIRDSIFRARKDDPGFAEMADRVARQEIMTKLDIDGDAFPFLKTAAPPSPREAYDVLQVIYRLKELKETNPEVTRKVIKFGNDLIDKYKKFWDETLASGSRGSGGNDGLWSIIRDIIMYLDSDHPEVLRFYHKVLPHYEWLGGDGMFGRKLMQLGRNGEPFLPWLRERLAKLEGKSFSDNFFRTRHEDAIERTKAIIDGIENGTGRSTKYKFY